MICMSIIGLSGVLDKKGVARKYFRHCSVGKIQDGRHLIIESRFVILVSTI